MALPRSLFQSSTFSVAVEGCTANCDRYFIGNPGDDPLRYRTSEEEAYYRARDCVDRFERLVLERDVLAEAELSQIDEDARTSIDAAVEFAEQSPPPAASELTTQVYTEGSVFPLSGPGGPPPPRARGGRGEDS